MSESPARALTIKEDEEKKPISELTLGEAEAYLEDSMCMPETVIGEWRQLRMYIFIYNLYLRESKTDGDKSTQKEKCLLDRAKDYVSKFDEEKEKVLEHADSFNIAVQVVGLVGSAGMVLSKYCLDPETATSACVVLSTASSVASLKIPDITSHQILMTVKKIEKNVNKILRTPLNTSLDTFFFILDAVETGNFESAYQRLPVLEEDSKKAFYYANGDYGKISLNSYKECAKAVKLHMFAIILRESYDSDKKMFINPYKLSDNKVNLIGRAFERIARQCIKQKKFVKTKSWGFEQESIKSDAQNVLDSIFAFAYPHISRAKKLTDINESVSNDGHFKLRLLPEFMPVGHEDKTQLIVGVQTNEDGEKSLSKIPVWRNETHVYFEYKGIVFYETITSESEPMDIKVTIKKKIEATSVRDKRTLKTIKKP